MLSAAHESPFRQAYKMLRIESIFFFFFDFGEDYEIYAVMISLNDTR